jgi:hypothetical protein
MYVRSFLIVAAWIAVSLAAIAIGVSVSWFRSTPPLFLPNGTVIARFESKGYGKLAIENGTAQDAVVKLVKSVEKRAIASVCVRANNKTELTSIPDGSYEIFITQGSDWDSASSIFTRSVSYSRFDKVADFKTKTVDRGGASILETPIWQITLQPVPLGNTKTESISEDDFRSK